MDIDQLNVINILGVDYSVGYYEAPSDVDPRKRQSLFGHIDFWTREINIYKRRKKEDVFQVLLHEILHGIADGLKLRINENENEDELDLLAMGLSDFLLRNGWIKIDGDEK